ncbi:MAG: ketopantoate reductase family protein [Spirochaetota bacterium]|nr:ketopantoate reductase family protein [Spirochaetota bacterium]
MKILLIGTGAIGCFFGGKIAKLGHDITFLSRANSYNSIKENGIEIKSDIETSFQTKVNIINALSPNAKFDLVIIATKSYDVKPLVDKLPDTLISSSYFVTIQNGVSSEDILLQKIEPTRLIPASAFIGIIKTEANIVYHSAGGRLQFGSYVGGPCIGVLDEFLNLLKTSNIDAHFTESIMKMKWGKLVWNAAYNPLSTITQLSLGDILSTQYGVKLLKSSMLETANIAKKMGYELNEKFIEAQINLPKNLYPFKTSMLQDFLSGKPLEIEAILGDLLKKGVQTEVPTPTLSHFYSILQILLDYRDKSNNP